jgi:HmuY protein
MRQVVVFAVLVGVGCNDSTLLDRLPSAGSGSAAQAGEAAPVLHEVSCIDQSIGTLNLKDDPAPDSIVEQTEEGGVFETRIDATAGGLDPRFSFVYARFTDDGLEQVELGDEDAFESGDWHIAFRRFVIRLNSGVSGPGDITVARTAPKTEFASLDAEPEALDYRTEQYFTETCEYISDGSVGAPASALASFWSYSNCLEMTGNVYVVAIGDRRVKLEVLAYYPDENQAICNETKTVPMPSGAGNYHVRWAFLE